MIMDIAVFRQCSCINGMKTLSEVVCQHLLLSAQMLVCLDLKALPSMPVLSVQVLELPADICDTVELQYRPPGHISAGLTCQITIMFTPKVWPPQTISAKACHCAICSQSSSHCTACWNALHLQPQNQASTFKPYTPVVL